MSGDMRFKKIKFAKDEETGKERVHLEYEIKKGADWDRLVLNSPDKPAPGFGKALEALAQDVVEMCELSHDDLRRVVVRGVSLSYAHDVMGATITAQKLLLHSTAPLILNTPHKIEEHYAEKGDDRQLLDEACARRISLVIDEAQKFVSGVRAQTDMFREQAA